MCSLPYVCSRYLLVIPDISLFMPCFSLWYAGAVWHRGPPPAFRKFIFETPWLFIRHRIHVLFLLKSVSTQCAYVAIARARHPSRSTAWWTASAILPPTNFKMSLVHDVSGLPLLLLPSTLPSIMHLSIPPFLIREWSLSICHGGWSLFLNSQMNIDAPLQ